MHVMWIPDHGGCGKCADTLKTLHPCLQQPSSGFVVLPMFQESEEMVLSEVDTAAALYAPQPPGTMKVTSGTEGNKLSGRFPNPCSCPQNCAGAPIRGFPLSN